MTAHDQIVETDTLTLESLGWLERVTVLKVNQLQGLS
jgi:hypothetical protein